VRQSFRIRKALRVESKNSIAVHVVNVEIDHIQRQISFAILSYYFLNYQCWIVTVTTLLRAQSPQWWERHITSQISVAMQNVFDRRPVEKVVVHLAALGTKPNSLLRQPAKVEVAAVTIVKENSVGCAVFESKIKRDCLVNRIAARCVPGCVGIPIHEETPALIEARGLFPQAVEVFVKSKLLRGRNKLTGVGIKHDLAQLTLSVVTHRLL